METRMPYLRLHKVHIYNPYQDLCKETGTWILESKELSEEEKNSICLAHMSLAVQIVSGYACLALDRANDMLGEAVLAIWKSVNSLDKMRDSNFTAYCGSQIHN